MDDVHYYTASVTWKNGRIGELAEEGFPSIEVATPPEFPGGVPNIWSPEHLYVASAVVCLMTTFCAIAENSNLSFSSFSCTGKGKLEKVERAFMITQIELMPVIKVPDERSGERAQRIIEKSERACLISNSMKSEIILKPDIIIG